MIKNYNEFLLEQESLLLNESFILGEGKRYNQVCFVVGGAGCFDKDTLVKMEVDYKKIKDISPGEKIWTFNEETKEIELDLVKEVFSHDYPSDSLLKLKFAENGETVICTESHLFLDTERTYGKWIPAKYLETASTKIVKSRKVYDLACEKNHNYIITKSNIIVHNSGKDYVLDNIAMANKATYKKISSDKVLEFISKGSKFLEKVEKVSSLIKQEVISEKSSSSAISRWIKSVIPSIFRNEKSLLQFLDKDLPYEIEETRSANPSKRFLPLISTKKAENVAFLRLVADIYNQYDEFIDNLILTSYRSSSANLPNLAIELIGKQSSLNQYKDAVLAAGYPNENIHMVWVVTNEEKAQENNARRTRSLHPSTLLSTHRSAALELSGVFKEDAKLIGGEIWIVLNSSETPVFIKDPNSTLSVKEQYHNWMEKQRKNPTSKDVSYVRIKESGKRIWDSIPREDRVKVTEAINQNVPERIFNPHRYNVSTLAVS